MCKLSRLPHGNWTRVRKLLPMVAVLGMTMTASDGWAQSPALMPPEPAAASAAKPEVDVLPGLPHPTDQPASLFQPGPTPAFTGEMLPQPYFDGDPRLDPPMLPQPGWLFSLEVGIDLPHVSNNIHDQVTLGGTTSTVQVPSARLDWTASPRFELGYRLPEGFGEFDLGYRFLVSSGTGTVQGPDSAAALTSRLNINVIDLDYGSNELSICSWWMKWRVGLRGADIYFDSRSDEPLAAAGASGASDVFERRDTNNFWGIGPHGSLELERRLDDWVGCCGFIVLARIDAATLLGRVDQGFFEVSTNRAGNGQFLAADTRRNDGGDVPIVNASIGLGWRPPRFPLFRAFVGYQYEHWWNVGRLENSGPDGEFYDGSILIRADFNY